MAKVKFINIIKTTDRMFTLVAIFLESGEPKDLSAFVGASGSGLKLSLPGEDDTLTLDLTSNPNGKLEVLTVASGLAGKVAVTVTDTGSALLKEGDGQDMELIIKEGAGPDFEVSKVQYPGKLNVIPCLFE